MYATVLTDNDSDLKLHMPLLRSLVEPNDVVIECGTRNMIAVFAFLLASPKHYIGIY